MTQPNINICGYGFVGGAMGHVCIKNNLKFSVYDVSSIEQMKSRNLNENDYTNFSYYNDLNKIVNESEKNNNINFYFICVPTPSDMEGNCDTTIVENVISQLNSLITKKSIIIIKSTVKPGTTRNIASRYSNNLISIIFCPEFLRELTYKDDIYYSDFTLFGLENIEDNDMRDNLSNLFTNYLYKHKEIKVYFKKYEECELFKYTINTFLAVKVWYFNEIYGICDKFNIDYQSFKTLFPLEPRIGDYGTVVPGYLGFGFSGKCLPKECRGMRQLQKDLDIPYHVLDEILKRNEDFRK